jgi:hypothetical protein
MIRIDLHIGPHSFVWTKRREVNPGQLSAEAAMGSILYGRTLTDNRERQDSLLELYGKVDWINRIHNPCLYGITQPGDVNTIVRSTWYSELEKLMSEHREVLSRIDPRGIHEILNNRDTPLQVSTSASEGFSFVAEQFKVMKYELEIPVKQRKFALLSGCISLMISTRPDSKPESIKRALQVEA